MLMKQAELKKQAYDSNLKSRALSVLIYLIDRSNKDLTCYPAIPTMAGQLHISVSTVKRALRELVQAGFIVKDVRSRDKNRGQTSNLYTLVLQEISLEPLDDETPNEEQKQESKSVCASEHLTFEKMIAERKPRSETVVSLACEIVDTPINRAEMPDLFQWTGEEASLQPP